MFLRALLVSLHDRIRDEGSRDLLATEPTPVEPIDGALRGIDGIELHINFTLRKRMSTAWRLVGLESLPENHARL